MVNFQVRCSATMAVSMLLFALSAESVAAVYDVDQALADRGLAKATQAQREAVAQDLVGVLRAGDVLLLSRRGATGNLDLSTVSDGITVRWGREGTIFLGGSHRGLTILDTRCRILPLSKAEYRSGLRKSSKRAFLSHSTIMNAPFISDMEMDNVEMVGVYVDGAKILDQMNSLRVTGQWTNCSVLYLWFEYHSGTPSVQFTNVDATNSKIYGVSETDYCASTPAVVFSQVKGLTYGNGDTERPNSPTGIYQFLNCTDMTLVCHRNFHSHGTSCATTQGTGYVVSGGSNNTFLMVQDIGNNAQHSFRISGTDRFKIFGFFLEDDEVWQGENVDPFIMFYTPFGFGGAAATKWSSPATIVREKIFSYKGIVIDTATASVNKGDFTTIEIPRPPLVPECTNKSGYGAGKRTGIDAVGQSWGSRAVAMGVDVTGRRSSHAALQAMVERDQFVEIPAGTILLDKPLVIPPRFGIPTLTIAGAGSARTRIVANGNFPSIVMADAAPALFRTGKRRADLAEVHVSGIMVDGGGTQDFGYTQTGIVGRTIFTGNTYTNFRKAGVMIGTASEIDNIKYILRGDGYDQCQWRSCSFINTGDYGLYCNREQVDKQLYYSCVFEGQKRAGLSIQRSHMIEASSVVNCTFKNIGGPSVFWGGNTIPGNGNGPVLNTMQNCLVEECGSDSLPAIQYSYTNQALVVNNRIIIKTKPWKYGYAGTAAVLQRNNVDVDVSKMVAGGAAFAIYHPRRMANNRVTGNTISDNTSQGPMKFVDGIGWFEERYGETLRMNAGRCEYPYAFTHLVSNCSFDGGKQSYDYALVRTTVDGAIQEVIPLGKGVRNSQPIVGAPSRSVSRDALRYDLSGRLMRNTPGRTRLGGNGVFLERTSPRLVKVRVSMLATPGAL